MSNFRRTHRKHSDGICIRLSISGWLNTQGYDLFMLVISRLCQLLTMHKQQWGGKQQEIFRCFLVHLFCFSDLSCIACVRCVCVSACQTGSLSLIFVHLILSSWHPCFSRTARTIVVRNNFHQCWLIWKCAISVFFVTHINVLNYIYKCRNKYFIAVQFDSIYITM